MKDFQIDWRAEAVPFLHTWEGLVNIDQFRWLVRGDVQAQLRMAHKELGARCVRAVGMFDDELRAMGIDPRRFAEPQNTACRPNYQILDLVMMFFVSTSRMRIPSITSAMISVPLTLY